MSGSLRGPTEAPPKERQRPGDRVLAARACPGLERGLLCRAVTGGLCRFGVLGPLVLERDGRLVPLPSGRQRSLLALLALSGGTPLSRDRLIDELWGERPPASAVSALHVHLSKVRSLLGGLLVLEPAGYALVRGEFELDLWRFEALLGRARSEPETAGATLREALAMFRGEPLCDVESEGSVAQWRRSLEEKRLQAIGLRVDADLAAGQAGELVAELERLTAEHPYEERLWGQLMLALVARGAPGGRARGLPAGAAPVRRRARPGSGRAAGTPAAADPRSRSGHVAPGARDVRDRGVRAPTRPPPPPRPPRGRGRRCRARCRGSSVASTTSPRSTSCWPTPSCGSSRSPVPAAWARRGSCSSSPGAPSPSTPTAPCSCAWSSSPIRRSWRPRSPPRWGSATGPTGSAPTVCRATCATASCCWPSTTSSTCWRQPRSWRSCWSSRRGCACSSPAERRCGSAASRPSRWSRWSCPTGDSDRDLAGSPGGAALPPAGDGGQPQAPGRRRGDPDRGPDLPGARRAAAGDRARRVALPFAGPGPDRRAAGPAAGHRRACAARSPRPPAVAAGGDPLEL